MTSVSTEKGSQFVGLRAKLERSRLIRIERMRNGIPSQNLGQRVGNRGDLGGFGIYLESRPDDDIAEVIGTRYRRDDYRKGKRSAFIWTGEVYLAGDR